MFRVKMMAPVAALALLAGIGTVVVISKPVVTPRPEVENRPYQLVAQSFCKGAGCNGRDPAQFCEDGISVASKDIGGFGLLELRYSRSCKANWGRFTPYRSLMPWVAYTSVYARVTAWNPGGTSYGAAHHSLAEGSSWSYMTNGEVEACTGVELSYVTANGFRGGLGEDGEAGTDWERYDIPDRVGWFWGPCY